MCHLSPFLLPINLLLLHATILLRLLTHTKQNVGGRLCLVLETVCFDRLLGMVDVLKRRCCTYRYIDADVYLDLVRAAT